MARKNRSLTSFADVSNDSKKDTKNNIENDIKNDIKNDGKERNLNNIENDNKNDSKKSDLNNSKNDTKNNSENNINIDSNNETVNANVNNSKLDSLLSGKIEKKKKPQYVYLDPEVVKLLDKYGGVKKKGRSSKKSELINEILKEFFRQRGDL